MMMRYLIKTTEKQEPKLRTQKTTDIRRTADIKHK